VDYVYSARFLSGTDFEAQDGNLRDRMLQYYIVCITKFAAIQQRKGEKSDENGFRQLSLFACGPQRLPSQLSPLGKPFLISVNVFDFGGKYDSNG